MLYCVNFFILFSFNCALNYHTKCYITIYYHSNWCLPRHITWIPRHSVRCGRLSSLFRRRSTDWVWLFIPYICWRAESRLAACVSKQRKSCELWSLIMQDSELQLKISGSKHACWWERHYYHFIITEGIQIIFQVTFYKTRRIRMSLIA